MKIQIALVTAGVGVRGFGIVRPSLEDVFVTLTYQIMKASQ